MHITARFILFQDCAETLMVQNPTILDPVPTLWLGIGGQYSCL